MKIKVDKLTYGEFKEYVDSSFAGAVKLSLAILLGIAAILIAIGFVRGVTTEAMTPLFWCAGILFLLIVFSGTGISTVFKKSGLADTACRYTLSEEGLDIVMGKLKGDLDWAHVNYVKETKNLWIMRVPNSQFILPKRCYDEKEFYTLVSACLPDDRIREMHHKKKEAPAHDGDENGRN